MTSHFLWYTLYLIKWPMSVRVSLRGLQPVCQFSQPCDWLVSYLHLQTTELFFF